jgi:pilus assembly protein CpaB
MAGIFAFTLVNGYVRRVEALAPALGEPVPIAIAARDLSRGTVLSEEMLRVETRPSAFSPPGFVSEPGSVVGRTLLSDLAAREPLTETRLGHQGSGPIASLVPPELRAFALVTSLPSGAVRSGDLVDVLATYAGGRPHTETVASGLEVLLALGDSYDRASGGLLDPPEPGLTAGTVLILLVTPDQAERLAYARAFADLSVTVAGPPAGEEVVDP